MQPSPNPTSVGQIHITVGDLDESIRFYRDLLGLTRDPDGNAIAIMCERPV